MIGYNDLNGGKEGDYIHHVFLEENVIGRFNF